MTATSFYDFTLKTIDGEDRSLGDYRGNVVLVVNVASKCGLTPHYKALQELYEQHASDGLTASHVLTMLSISSPLSPPSGPRTRPWMRTEASGRRLRVA